MHRFVLFAASVCIAGAAHSATISVPNGSVSINSFGGFTGSAREEVPFPPFPTEIYSSSISGGYDAEGNVSGTISYENTVNRCCLNGEVYQEIETYGASISGQINFTTGAYSVAWGGPEPGAISGVSTAFLGLGPRPYHEVIKDIVATQCQFASTQTERAGCALSHLIDLRERGGSLNLENRDAEYWLRNYIGGELIRLRAAGDEIPPGYEGLDEILFQNPAATAGYNLEKEIKNYLGTGDSLRAQEGNPNTPPGGFDASVEGFKNGLMGVDFDTALNNSVIDAANPLSPIRPIPKSDTDNPDRDVFLESVESIPIYGFDPSIGSAYDFEIAIGPGVASIGVSALPGQFLSADFLLKVWDDLGSSIEIGVDETATSTDFLLAFGTELLFDFRVLATSEFDGDYLLDLSFGGDGLLLMSRETVVTTGAPVGDGNSPAPVPLPASAWFLLLGLASLVAMGWYRSAES